MERYGGIQAMDAVPVDETGLEESMWPLSVGGGLESYPERPDATDCIYYLRTGFCGYGDRCRFNHPRDRSVAMGALRASGSEYPERVGQTVCQYYMRTGTCKFGASCKYHHPKHAVGSSAPVAANIYGYPLRPGEKECSYYVKTGQCKFGVTCKFDHPQPSGVQLPPQVQSSPQYGVIPGTWPVARQPMIPGSYGSYGPMLLPHGVVPIPGWTHYPASVNPVATPNSTQHTVGAGPVYGVTQLSPSAATTYTGAYLPTVTYSVGPSSSSQKEHAFPDRPGQPECQYYLRTGDCKFGSSCRYHHPQEENGSETKTDFGVGPMGLPLRPGTPVCSHYALAGICKFGPSCKFDHPIKTLSYSPSASSITNTPIAPSTSSSDLRPEILSGFTKGSFSSQSASLGSTFSKSEPGPQSGQAGLTSSSEAVHQAK